MLAGIPLLISAFAAFPIAVKAVIFFDCFGLKFHKLSTVCTVNAPGPFHFVLLRIVFLILFIYQQTCRIQMLMRADLLISTVSAYPIAIEIVILFFGLGKTSFNSFPAFFANHIITIMCQMDTAVIDVFIDSLVIIINLFCGCVSTCLFLLIMTVFAFTIAVKTMRFVVCFRFSINCFPTRITDNIVMPGMLMIGFIILRILFTLKDPRCG